MNYRLYFLLVLLLTLGCRDGYTTGQPITTWHPDATLLDRLGPLVNTSEYSIRPPTNYTQIQGEQTGSSIAGWRGRRRLDGTAAMIQVGVIRTQAGRKTKNLHRTLDKLLAGIQRRQTNWSESELTVGNIGGIKFVKKTWTGQETSTGIEMYGIMYVGIAENQLFQLATQDAAPYHEHSLKLGETSLLTFTTDNPSSSNVETGESDLIDAEDIAKTPAITSPESAVLRDAQDCEFGGFIFKLPKRFTTSDMLSPDDPQRKFKSASWEDMSGGATNATFVAFSGPVTARTVSIRKHMEDTLTGTGYELHAKGKTQSLLADGVLLSGFGFSGKPLIGGAISGSIFTFIRNGRDFTFFTLVIHGDHDKTNTEIMNHLATLREIDPN